MEANEIELKVNEKLYQVGRFNPDLSLNTFLRQIAKLPGTKFMCREGGCGACVVTAKRQNPFTLTDEVLAINSVSPIKYCW